VSEVPEAPSIRIQRSDDESKLLDRIALKLAGGALAAVLVLAVPSPRSARRAGRSPRTTRTRTSARSSRP